MNSKDVNVILRGLGKICRDPLFTREDDEFVGKVSPMAGMDPYEKFNYSLRNTSKLDEREINYLKLQRSIAKNKEIRESQRK